MKTKPKLLFFSNTDWYLYNFRLPLLKMLQAKGCEVLLMSPHGPYVVKLEQEGFRHIAFPLSRRGINPLHEIKTVFLLAKLYRLEELDIVHHFTVKCVLYGTLAARLCKIKTVVNSITGLGYVFITEGLKAGLLRKLVSFLYRRILNHPNSMLIFQNHDDMNEFGRNGLIRENKALLIRGSGVDVSSFVPHPEPEGVPVVALVSRMLWDKGVSEYVSAASLLKKSGVNARFVLIGDNDAGNPASIERSKLEEWNRDGNVEWWGQCSDMHEVFARIHIVCLPSYREGLPRVLIEAGACGRPVVTTDVPGCREVVNNGENGLLVPARNVTALSDALKLLIENPALRREMGLRGREKVIGE